ncbi:MAG: anti-sigma factor [Paucibacter sp.]|nr:anti-sigma factor [Roseateles sp.]
MNDDELSRLLREHASRHPASERLHAAVRTQTALQSAARERKPSAAPSRVGAIGSVKAWLRRHLGAGAVPVGSGRLGWIGTGGVLAGLMLGVALTLAVQSWQARPAELADDIVAGHVRALQVGPLFEVSSSSHHQVRPWFQGRLDYAPPVLDNLPGFALLGGRVQSLRGKPTAVLAYQAGLHKIDLFVWPAERGAAPERLQRRGFNIVHWSDGAMQYWAVSDMEGGELERFGAQWRAGAG